MAQIDTPNINPKPTSGNEPTEMGNKFEKNFSGQMNVHDVQLEEVNNSLSDKSLARKAEIWDLAKMEALVHSDEILSGVYNQMKKAGRETYGYHYNETIMNMIFNDKVLDNSDYEQKYMNSIPVEKKRRDDSGINKLQQKGAEKQQTKSHTPKDRPPAKREKPVQPKKVERQVAPVRQENDVKIHNNSLEGVIEEELADNNGFKTAGRGTFDDREYLDRRIEKKYDTMEEPIVDKKDEEGKIPNLPIEEHHLDNYGDMQQFILQKYDENPKLVNDILFVNNCVEDHLEELTVDQIKGVYHELEKRLGMIETTGAASSGAYSAPIGYQVKNNVYEGEDQTEKRDDGEEIDETTTSASSGSYETPHAFAAKGSKGAHRLKPAWDGGEIIGEGEYLTSPEAYKKLVEELNESFGNEDDNASYSTVPMAEKAESKKQQKFMGMVHAQQKGEMDNPSPEIEKVANQMNPDDVTDFASTKHAGIPEKVLDEAGDKYNDFINLANQLDSSQFGDEDNVINQYAATNQMTIDMLKFKIQGFIDSGRAGHETNEYFQLENLVSIINDMMDTQSNFANQERKDAAQREFDRTPYGKDMARQQGMVGEGMIEPNPESMSTGGENPTTMMKTMKDVDSPYMGEGVDNNAWNEMTNDERESSLLVQVKDPDEALSMVGMNFDSLPNHVSTNLMRESKKAEDNNALADFGTSEHGVDGFEYKNGQHKETKPAEDFGRKSMDKLGEADHHQKKHKECRNDEKPVLGKIAGEQGSCEKKVKKTAANSFAKAGENKHNEKVRKQRQTDYETSLVKKEKEKTNTMEKKKEKTVAEAKKPSALIQLDRLQKDNAKNFKADANNSNSADIAKDQKNMEAFKGMEDMGAYTDVGDPQKAGSDIEKEVLKTNKEALLNVGDSANENGKEVIKRNHTDEEQGDIDIIRNGMHSWKYDNETNEKFEERMKADMGEDVWEIRKKQLAAREDEPRYEKEAQPVVEEGVKRDERMITGKYRNGDNQLKFIDFRINECNEIAEVNESYFKLNLDGLGNVYTSLVKENEDMRNFMDSFTFYFKEDEVVRVPTGNQILSEGEVKETKEPINEQLEAMKKLMGYKPLDNLVRPNFKNL